MRRALFVGLVVPGLMMVACSDPMNSQKCTVEIESGCWTRLGLENEWVAEIAVTPWGLFVGTADHGIFRLESNGRWKALGPRAWHNRLIPKALLYVPTDRPRLLVGLTWRYDSNDTTRAAVYASFDRGESWVPHDGGLSERSKFPFRVFVDDLEVDPSDPQRVFMGTIHGVLRSLDAGETWQFVVGDFDNLSNGFVDILVDADPTERLWVGGQSLIFTPFVGVSHDLGETWNADIPTCNGAVIETPIYELALDPNRANRLWAGVNGGVRWSDEAGAPESWECGPGPRGDAVDLMVLDNALYAATVFLEFEEGPGGDLRERSHLGLYRTANGGENWDSLPVPDGASGATEAAADTAAGRLLIGTRTGLWALTP